MNYLILSVFGCWALWIIRKDTAERSGVSAASWIPTLWVGILASRPVSAWFGIGGVDTLDGSPIDRFFFLTMIAASLVVLSRRGVSWGEVLARNWPITLFYAFLLISVTWANSPTASFKRWFKEVGNIAVVLVILTEVNPLQAMRAVFVRCAYVLIPLSLIFVRYFPHLGRHYNLHSGAMEATGVTFQKNSLGTMILVCGLILIWDWIERSKPGAAPRSFVMRLLPPVVLGIGMWLLVLCDSKTSMLCLVIGGVFLSALRLPILNRRMRAFGGYFLLGLVGLFVLDWSFGISQYLVSSLGRDMTFTGRTEVWRELLNVKTDPLFGTGFMSFWDDMRYRSILPKWVAFSAHNGYLEVYLAGGFVGVTFLGIMLLAIGLRIQAALAQGDEFAVVRFSAYVATLIANFSETNFACMTPLGFLFLLVAIGHCRAASVSAAPASPWTYRPMPYAPPMSAARRFVADLRPA